MAAIVAVFLGYGEPYFSLSLFPFGGVSLFVLIGVLVYGAKKGSGLIEAWEWEAAGHKVGLTPLETDLPRESLSYRDQANVEKSILAGQVQGYPVRARAFKESSGSGQGSSTRSVMIVEADLNQPVEEGMIIEPAESEYLWRDGLINTVESGPMESDIFEEGPNVPGTRFVALADPPELARGVLSGRARDTMAEITTLNRVLVGNAEEVFRDALPDYEEKVSDIVGESIGSAVDSGIKTMAQGSQIRGDAQTVTHYVTSESILDPAELERRVDAVVAVAKAFERERASGQSE